MFAVNWIGFRFIETIEEFVIDVIDASTNCITWDDVKVPAITWDKEIGGLMTTSSVIASMVFVEVVIVSIVDSLRKI